MPARIEFIPYGERWEPIDPPHPDIKPGSRATFNRKPTEDQTRYSQISVRVDRNDLRATVIFAPKGFEDDDYIRRGIVDGETLVIHRAVLSVMANQPRGTLRITHIQGLAGDREGTGVVADPGPIGDELNELAVDALSDS